MATHAQGSKEENRNYWQSHIISHKSSGISRVEYCRQHNLSYHAMTYWHKKISGKVQHSVALVPVPLSKISLLDKPASNSGVKIMINGRMVIEVACNFSAETLGSVLAVVENR